jgi:hypothetical protein
MKTLFIVLFLIISFSCKKETIEVWKIVEKISITDTTKLDSTIWKYVENITYNQKQFIGTEEEIFLYKKEHDYILYFTFKEKYGKFFTGYEKHEVSFFKLK